MKTNLATICTGVVLALAAAPASACGFVNEEAAFIVADLVVEGTVRCDQQADECTINVRETFKNIRFGKLQPRQVTFAAGFRAMEVIRENDYPIMCFAPFSPEQDGFRAMFYLRRGEDAQYRIWRWMAPDEAGVYPDW